MRENIAVAPVLVVSMDRTSPSREAAQLQGQLFMPTFPLPDVREQPEVSLTRWLVIELLVAPLPNIPGPYRFVIGHNAMNGYGRASSLIIMQDRDERRVRTKSGRLYILEGPPGYDDDAWWTFQRNGGRTIRVQDVSAEFWPGHRAVDLNGVESQRAEILDALRQAGYSVSEEQVP